MMMMMMIMIYLNNSPFDGIHVAFSHLQISESLKERILEFHKRANQVYGAFDFLECDDDVIFLECNSAGAWLWLEQAVGIKVSEAIARYLLGMEETDSPEK